MPNVTYPLDLTGVAPTNLIENELHTVSESHYRDYFFIVPNFSPFYIDNFSAKITTNGNTRELVEDVDFSFAIPYIAGTRTTGKAMYGAITLHNLEMNGILSLTYQTVGGDQVADRLYVLTILADKAYNPRTTIWELLTNVPNAFPPLPHYQDYDEFYGQEEVVNQLGAIRDAIANGSVDVKSKLDEVLQLIGPGGLLNFLPLSGGTMTGDLILNDDPHTDLQAATKRYVDSNIINQSSLASILSNYVDRDYFTKLVDELRLFVVHNSSSSAFYEELRQLKNHLEQKLYQQILPNYLTRTQFNELADDLKVYVTYMVDRASSYQNEILTYSALLEVLKDYVTNDTLTTKYLDATTVTSMIDELKTELNRTQLNTVKKEDVLTILKSNNVNQSQLQAIETQIADLQTKYDEIKARMSVLDTTIHS